MQHHTCAAPWPCYFVRRLRHLAREEWASTRSLLKTAFLQPQAQVTPCKLLCPYTALCGSIAVGKLVQQQLIPPTAAGLLQGRRSSMAFLEGQQE